MVTVKNVLVAATCVATALAAPSQASKRQWGGWGGNGGNWGQPQGQNGGWGQGQTGGSAAGSSNVPSTTGQAQSSGNTGSTGAVDAGNSGSANNSGSAGSSNLAAVSGETLTSSSSGQKGDYYYSHWVENDSSATMTIDGGSYSLEWTEGAGNVVSGLGWNPASAKYARTPHLTSLSLVATN